MSARIDTAAERARLDGLTGNTPGPWSQEHRRALDGGFRTQVFPSADPMNTIATLHWHSVPIEGGERTDRAENAALIASAPDLLTSYRAALDEIDRLRAENDKLRADMSGGSFYQEKDIDAMLETVETMRSEIEELDFLRHEGGPQSVAAMEALLRDTVLPILRRSAEDLFRCVSIRNVPSSVAPSDWRDIAEDMEAVLAVEAFVGRPDDEYGRTLNPILDARMWEAHR